MLELSIKGSARCLFFERRRNKVSKGQVVKIQIAEQGEEINQIIYLCGSIRSLYVRRGTIYHSITNERYHKGEVCVTVR